MDDKARKREFFKRHCGLRESAWAAEFSDLSREERQRLRKQLLELAKALPEGCPPELRGRWLVALDSLDSLHMVEDPTPTAAVRKEVATLLCRVASAGAKPTGRRKN